MKTKRIKDYFTLDADVHKDFYEIIENNSLNKSKLLEKLIKEYINKMKNSDQKM